MKQAKKNAFIKKMIIALCIVGSYPSFADVVSPQADQSVKNLVPGSAEPSVISKQFSAPATPSAPLSTPSITAPKEKPSSALGPKATEIKFKLNKIILEGNHFYSDEKIAKLYKDKIGKTITVAELEAIVQNITNYYRNNGYILTRAVLPPQHVAGGIVHIRVVEGYIDQVKVIGKPRGARDLIYAYGKQISDSRPLQIQVMEHYLRITNEIPGASVRSVLEPSKTTVGAADMNLIAEEKTFGASLTYNNYGTRYAGPNEYTATANANSIFTSGDSTRFTMVRTARPLELQYIEVAHDTPIGSNGLVFTVGGNNSRTRSGFVLTPIKLDGDASVLYGTLQYPLLRTKDKQISLDGGFSYIDSWVNTFDDTLYVDHLRTVKGGASYNFADHFLGYNLLGAHIEQGLNILGSTNNSTSETTSRFGGEGVFTKLTAQFGRMQQLHGRYSAFIFATGQYSFVPLLAYEQFAFGGPSLGRAYDPAEIIGDRGITSSVELRANYAPDMRYLQTLQPFLFYDVGVIWNMKHVAGVKVKQSAASTGFGIRFTFNKYFSGNLMIAQPLTKQIAAEAILGDGRRPRGYFSVTAAI